MVKKYYVIIIGNISLEYFLRHIINGSVNGFLYQSHGFSNSIHLIKGIELRGKDRIYRERLRESNRERQREREREYEGEREERDRDRQSERGIHNISVTYHNCYFEPLYIACRWESS